MRAPEHTRNKEISGNRDGRHDIFKGHAALCSPGCFHGFIDKKVALVSDNKSADGSAGGLPFGFHSICNVVMKFWSTHCPSHTANHPQPTRPDKARLSIGSADKTVRKVLGSGRTGGSEKGLGLNWRLREPKLKVANLSPFPKGKGRKNVAVQNKSKNHSSTIPLRCTRRCAVSRRVSCRVNTSFTG